MLCSMLTDCTLSASHRIFSSVLMWSVSHFHHCTPISILPLSSYNIPSLSLSFLCLFLVCPVSNYCFSWFLSSGNLSFLFFSVFISQCFFHCQPCAHILAIYSPLLSSLLSSLWPGADVGSGRTRWLTKRGWIPFASPVDIKRSRMLCRTLNHCWEHKTLTH